MKKIIFLLSVFFSCLTIFNSCNHNDDDPIDPIDDENIKEIISPNYIHIDWTQASLISYNHELGEYKINFSGEVPEIQTGSIVAIDQDTLVKYVFVEQANIEENIVSMTTSEAYLTDIFANTTISLTSDKNQADADVFLPTEIFYLDEKGNKHNIVLKAVNNNNRITNTLWNSSNNIDTSYILSGDNYKVFMEKLLYNIDVDFIVKMNFGERNVLNLTSDGLERYQSNMQNIESYLVGNFDTEQTIRFSVDGECSDAIISNETLKENFFVPLNLKFFVHDVPVLINISADLILDANLSMNGYLESSVYYRNIAEGKLGLKCLQGGSVTPMRTINNNYDFSPIDIKGKGNIDSKMYVFPRMKISLNNKEESTFDYKPYISSTINGGYDEDMIGIDNNVSAWTINYKTMIDVSSRLNLGFIGRETENYFTGNFNLRNKLLYTSPEKIVLIEEEDLQIKGQGKRLTFEVLDRNHLTDSYIRTNIPQIVELESFGNYFKQYKIAKDGIVSLDLFLSDEDILYARLLNAEGNLISQAVIRSIIEVTTSEVSNITTNSAVCSGSYNSTYEEGVYEKGICWGLYPYSADVNNNKIVANSDSENFSCTITDLYSYTTYYVRAYIKTFDDVIYGEEISFTTEKIEHQSDGNINGYEYVDLGLPSGLKWATCNVGASYVEDIGNYYAWGEVEEKKRYNIENSITFDKPMPDISGNIIYDAATANCGATWRIPTKKEILELVTFCESECIKCNGVWGTKFIGPNKKSIFLPYTGYKYQNNIDCHWNQGGCGFYWCSTPYTDEKSCIIITEYAQDVIISNTTEYRYLGMIIRAVSE